MNRTPPWKGPSRFVFRFAMKSRRLLPKRRSQTFGLSSSDGRPRIERVYVINLDRQPARWADMERELGHILDFSGSQVRNLTRRYAAVDASHFVQEPSEDADVVPYYTLADQLFVEPQPLALPTRFELTAPIRMSRPEVAIARSHIGVWRQIAAGTHEYALVLEDDVRFRFGFAPDLDKAWGEIKVEGEGKSNFDILYVSYEEAKYGAPKTFLSTSVFRPERGLWYLSGYVISREGAQKLLRLLPCRGPVDLWINHQFGELNVLATRRAIVAQRRDVSSTNSYSALPALTGIGAISSEGASLFHIRPCEKPVFAFGPEGSGLSSLAMALSMLGYGCCADLHGLPGDEHDLLLSGADDRVFDAYVNIRSLAAVAPKLRERYPGAKFIVTTSRSRAIRDSSLGITLDDLKGADVAFLDLGAPDKWQVVCEHLRCAPPACSFPEVADRGCRPLLTRTAEAEEPPSCRIPKRDKSPWVIESRQGWHGIHCAPVEGNPALAATPVKINDRLRSLDTTRWLPRNDTFTDNMALFRPSNIEFISGRGATFSIRQEHLGVREYSAAALTSRDKYLYGRFEAVIRASKVPGVVTGFFLHRDSPRQEIDIEIAGKRTDRLLVNVFYNPGAEGTKFDYGYRGAASYVDLGFDASESDHLYAIEWEPCEIRWLVDNRLVHSRAEWEPTPIPHLPMALHVNAWPPRSRELAGRLTNRRLPASISIRSVALAANRH